MTKNLNTFERVLDALSEKRLRQNPRRDGLLEKQSREFDAVLISAIGDTGRWKLRKLMKPILPLPELSRANSASREAHYEAVRKISQFFSDEWMKLLALRKKS